MGDGWPGSGGSSIGGVDGASRGGSSRGGSGTERGGSLAGGSAGGGSWIGGSEEAKSMPPSLCNRRASEKPRQVGERVDAVEEAGVAALAVEEEGPQTGAAGAAVVLDERITDVEDLGGRQVEARAGAQEDVRLRFSRPLDGRNG